MNTAFSIRAFFVVCAAMPIGCTMTPSPRVSLNQASAWSKMVVVDECMIVPPADRIHALEIINLSAEEDEEFSSFILTINEKMWKNLESHLEPAIKAQGPDTSEPLFVCYARHKLFIVNFCVSVEPRNIEHEVHALVRRRQESVERHELLSHPMLLSDADWASLQDVIASSIAKKQTKAAQRFFVCKPY